MESYAISARRRVVAAVAAARIISSDGAEGARGASLRSAASAWATRRANAAVAAPGAGSASAAPASEAAARRGGCTAAAGVGGNAARGRGAEDFLLPPETLALDMGAGGGAPRALESTSHEMPRSFHSRTSFAVFAQLKLREWKSEDFTTMFIFSRKVMTTTEQVKLTQRHFITGLTIQMLIAPEDLV